MRRAKSLRNGVHHANAVVWEPGYGTHFSAAAAEVVHHGRRELVDVVGFDPSQVAHRNVRDDGVSIVHDRQRGDVMAVHRVERVERGRVPLADAQGRSIRANVGVEFKGVRWR